jgi:glycine/D-amino acid oxidase-like deaminating enzyme
LREFVESNAVPCGLTPTGGVSIVGNPLSKHDAAVDKDHRGTPSDPDVLDGLTPIDPDALLGAAPNAFTEGYLDAGVASLWPARVALALAESAARAGVHIVEGCAVTGMETRHADDGDCVVVRTSLGDLTCEHVVVATNGWMPRLVPALAPHFRACTNTVLASEEPVPPELRWPVAVVCCGGGAGEVYCSQGADGTIVCGGLRDCNLDGMWAGDDDGGAGDKTTSAALERWYAVTSRCKPHSCLV